MNIIVKGKRAAIKKGSSFEYVQENRFFTGADGYTLSITFPLAGCPENQEIFGDICRQDVLPTNLLFDCDIVDTNFAIYGSLAIVGLNETEVKGQFLSGRSSQNYSLALNETYINEMDLGAPASSSVDIPPGVAWGTTTQDVDAVALPWVNDASGNIQNCAKYDPLVGAYVWHNIRGLSWQPYLIFIAKQIAEAIGYDYDFEAWEEDETYSKLIVCNALPYAWDVPSYSRALPHWTVEEFFDKLEKFMNAEFDFDIKAKVITCRFTEDVMRLKEPVVISDVVYDYSSDIKIDGDQCEYAALKNIVYKGDGNMWKYYDCDWAIKLMQSTWMYAEYDTLSQLIASNRSYANWDGRGSRGSNVDKLFYARDKEMFLAYRSVSRVENGTSPRGRQLWLYRCLMEPVNIFGGRIVNDEAEEEELEFVPVCIDWTDDEFGYCQYLSFGTYDEDNGSTDDEGTRPGRPGQEEVYDEDRFADSTVSKLIKSGDPNSSKSEYYDKIYVAWWNGVIDCTPHIPHPHVSSIEVKPDMSGYREYPFSLRINNDAGRVRRQLYSINPKSKVEFKFLAEKVPDVRALFYIKGKRYVCEKLTATFTEDGMSQLVKGTFYPVI